MQQKYIEIYSTKFCPFCIRAKSLLAAKNVKYTDIDINNEEGKKQEMIKRSDGATSVPQIFVDDQHIGGSDKLYSLEEDGQLDSIIGIE